MSIKQLYFPNYLTEDQKITLNSIKQLDKSGNLYYINYVADYKIDEVISEYNKSYNLDISVSKVLIPGSPEKLKFSVNELGCSCFCTINNEGSPILARNYDFFNTDHICAVCRTNSVSGYAFIGALDLHFFGIRNNNLNENNKRLQLLYSPFQVQDGINEKGFACAILMLFEGKTVQNTGKPSVLSTMVVNLLLNKASCVEEAVSLLQKYDIIAFFENIDYNHKWIMCDAKGDKAVIGYTDNKINVIRSNRNFISSANYYQSKPIKSQIGKGFMRKNTLDHFLTLNPNPSNETAMKYLKNVRYSLHYDYMDSDILQRNDRENDITYWSEIFDTKKKNIKLVFKEDYDITYGFEL